MRRILMGRVEVPETLGNVSLISMVGMVAGNGIDFCGIWLS